MTDTVTPLFGGEVQHSDKQMMLDYVAQRFDEMAAEGTAPVCLVFGFVSEQGTAQCSYMTSNVIKGHNVLHISRAVMAINCDYQVWDHAPD